MQIEFHIHVYNLELRLKRAMQKRVCGRSLDSAQNERKIGARPQEKKNHSAK